VSGGAPTGTVIQAAAVRWCGRKTPARSFTAAGPWGRGVAAALCAWLLACTDPRARPAPPTIKVFAAAGLRLTSPGAVLASIYATDVQGLDSIVVSLRSTFSALQGDSTFLVADTTAQTTNVIWQVPSGVPTGTRVVLLGTAYNLIGFAARDSAILTVEP